MAETPSGGTGRTRLTSLDALRGFDMFWIMGADALGGVAAAMVKDRAEWVRHLADQLEHVPWEGFRFYDLIFPLFVFIAGVSLILSLGRLEREKGKDEALIRLVKRAFLIYLLGVLYYGGWSKGWDQVRWMGVLQRIAISYLGAGFCVIFFKARTCAFITGGLLIGYWALMCFVPVPEFGAGNFDEGKNLANWIDLKFLPGRKWDGTHDPEGLLSNLAAVATCLLGTFAGRWLVRTDKAPASKSAGLAVAGVVLLALGFAWSFQFPIIKKIWTSSYVLVAGGWSCLLLALFHWVIDVRGWSGWCRPFVWVGLNPISVYLAANLVSMDNLARRVAGGPLASGLNGWMPHLGDMVLALVGIGWCFLLAWFLDRRKLYIRL